MEKEYVVTCKSKEDLDSLYEDMEGPYTNGFIPGRRVDCVERRPISRNTHYLLTHEEADILRNDPRVLDVELSPSEKGIVIHPAYTQSGAIWVKNNTATNTHKNWGLLRTMRGSTVSGWGSNGTTSQTAGIRVTSAGKNVDVVIVDGHINPAHPEFAINADGTGGSRVVQYNWFTHNPTVKGTSAGTYVYTPYTGTGAEADNNHGMHVAGTVAGNTQGWARESNIYNINPYSTNPNGDQNTYLYDYIRAWHNSKSVNPKTGRKNPTVTNNSWGSSYPGVNLTDISYVVYRGVQYNKPGVGWTVAELENFGLLCGTTTTDAIPAITSGWIADAQDAINDGIIIVGAAGNDYFKSDVSTGVDYNNRFFAGSTYYYHRGSQPSHLDNVICVGNIDVTSGDYKRNSSTCGPRIDVYAPGSGIISAVHTGGTTDSRNASYRLDKYSGTSMASPQVCGLLACVAEQWPRISQSEAMNYIKNYASKLNQMTITSRDTRSWTLTASGSSSYTFAGFSTGNNIAITCPEGTILNFTNNTGFAHPLWIKTTQTTGNTGGVTTGTITNNGGTNGAVVTWDTFGVAPGTYYYICEYHSAMTGTITITSAYNDVTSVQATSNKTLYYPPERKVADTSVANPQGAAIQEPRYQYKSRASSGMVFPRPHIWHRNLT